MLKKYCEAINYIYGKKVIIKKRVNFFSVRIGSKTIVSDLIKHAKFGIHTWNLPSKLLITNTLKKKWLKSFMSAEAYVGQNHIKVQTVNKNGMKLVGRLLKDLEIEHNYYEYTPKNPKHSKVSMIFISKKKSRIKYHKKIGFYHLKKTRTLKKTLGL